MKYELKKESRGFSVDMSPEAVARRFEIVGELYEAAKWIQSFSLKEESADKAQTLKEETTGYKMISPHSEIASKPE